VKKSSIVALVVVSVLLFVSTSMYGCANSLRSEGVRHESGLSAQYQSGQNYLSAYVSGFYEQIGVANLKSDNMDKILLDAVKGRYDGKTNAAPDQKAMFSAMVEAYPNLSSLDVYDKIMNYVASNREGFRNIQEKLLDMLRSYDNWRQDGVVQTRFVEYVLGFPTTRLEARITGEPTLTGPTALAKMREIVLTGAAVDAFKTGKMAPLSVGGK